MNDQKRALLAAVLSFGVLIGWYVFFGQKNVPSPVAPTPVTVSPTPSPLPAQEGAATATSISTKETEVEEQATEIQTPLFGIRWTNRGGRPAAFHLKRFREDVSRNSAQASFLTMTDEKALSLRCLSCSVNLPGDDQYRQVAQGENNLAYEGMQEGLRVRKVYQWSQSQYLLNLKVTLQNQSEREFRGRLGLEWFVKQFPHAEKGFFDFLKGPGNQRTLLYKHGNDVVRDQKTQEPVEVRGMIPWAGVEDRYFLMSLISRRVSSEESLRYQITKETVQFSLVHGETVIPPGGAYEENYSFYVGPKDRDSLIVANVELEKAIDYGWFSFFAIPILKLLQFFHRFVGNWGLAIIILTNPLTIKSMKQMKEMQKLQPKLQELKEKYAKDRQRLNMETMQLFRSHGVNPMGGCLPMLLQMPIYIALYKVLYNSIEIYHAPFFGFYRDLSAPDPYFIMPALLGIFMFLQQKLTPTATTDPVQKQMMTIMPIMFTGFMLFLPLGLVVYILVNTSTGVLQQWMSQKDIRWRDLPKLLSRKTAA